MLNHAPTYFQVQHDVSSWRKITIETVIAMGMAIAIYSYGVTLFR